MPRYSRHRITVFHRAWRDSQSSAVAGSQNLPAVRGDRVPGRLLSVGRPRPQRGNFVNEKIIDFCIIKDDDAITFGLDESYEIIFHGAEPETVIENILNRIE